MRQNSFDPYNPEEQDMTIAEKIAFAAVFLTMLALFQAITSHLWPHLFLNQPAV